MPTGKVKFYREDSGYGLVEPDDGPLADPSVEIFREDRRVRYVERVSQRSGVDGQRYSSGAPSLGTRWWVSPPAPVDVSKS